MSRYVTAGQYQRLLTIIEPQTLEGVFRLMFTEPTDDVRFWLRVDQLFRREAARIESNS